VLFSPVSRPTGFKNNLTGDLDTLSQTHIHSVLFFDQFDGLDCHQRCIAVMPHRHHQWVNNDILDLDNRFCGGIDDLAREK